MDTADCPLGVKHEAEIVALKESVSSILADVKEIKDKLLSRPSWMVTVVITLLSTLAFSALTFSFTVIHEGLRLGIMKIGG